MKKIILKTQKLLFFASVFCALSLNIGCASNTRKYADKVGCKGDATVTEDSSSPLHETYLVECNGKSYKCIETPIGTSCNKK